MEDPVIHRNYFLLLWIIVTFATDSQAFSQGSIGNFFYVNFMISEFSYLNITSIGRNLIQDENDCGYACLEIPSCFSYNIAAFPDVNGKLLCELLSSDKFNNSDKFNASRVFHHFYIPSLCDSSPCKNTGKCISLYQENGYKCICVEGFTGKNCETNKDESSSSQWNITDGLLSHLRLNGTDSQVNLKGSARYEEQDGRTALYLDGSSGTFAETPSLPIHRTNLTIALWIKMKNSGAQYTVYGDWSSPWSFRLYIDPSSHICVQARNEYDKDFLALCSRDAVRVNQWSHVAMTWGRKQGTLRLFINGEMNVSKNVTSQSKDFMNSGHSVFDIGLKRDNGNTAHAYYSDLMVFSRELLFSSTENVNHIKEHLVLNHPLYAYI